MTKRFGTWLWREAAAKAAIAAILFQAILVSFCHLPLPQPAVGDGTLAVQSGGATRLSTIICSVSGARTIADAGTLNTLPTLFQRVPPPDHQETWSCPACFVLFAAGLAILALFVLRPPVQRRPLFAAPERAWLHVGLVLHPHPTRGPPPSQAIA